MIPLLLAVALLAALAVGGLALLLRRLPDDLIDLREKKREKGESE